jgi:tetratricopeptide (TPR) repeat protein
MKGSAKKSKGTTRSVTRPKRVARNSIKSTREKPAAVAPEPPPPAPQSAPAPRKPTFYEAITLYESGVRALQRHDYDAGAEAFRAVLQRYPEERELLERARLYLRVCERETSQRPAGPQTPQERVYAATMALNAGDAETALNHLQRAIDQDPDNDHAHYILAVALSTREQPDRALQHLRRAITLNPDNRSLARQDPDLESVRDLDEFRSVLDTPAAFAKSRPRGRR